jgi:hypothetical protein
MEQKINSTVFDVASKSEVTLSKVFDFKPPATQEEALTRIGNDSAKFLDIVTEGLRQYERQAATNDPNIPWVDESGETFVGDVLTEEQSGKLNTTVLTMAKTMFGYVQGKAGTAEGRKKAKDDAQKFVLELPGFLEKLRG